MRKILTIMLAVCCLFSMNACGKKEDKRPTENKVIEAGENAPVYSDNGKDVTVGMWVGVPERIYSYDDQGYVIQGSGKNISDEQFLSYYKDVKDAGINLAYPGYGEMNGGSKAYNIRCLEAAEQVGINQIIADAGVKSYMLSAKELVDNGIATEEEIIAKIKEMCAPYKKYKAFKGFMIKDEPNYSLLEPIGFASKLFKQAEPDLVFYVNLFPVIAGVALGGANYNQYVDEFFKQFDTDYVCYDHYPLFDHGIEETFLYNMDIIKRKAGSREMWSFLQSIKYGSNHRGLNSKADSSFQVNSLMCYGGMGVQWFCYWSPPGFDGATIFGEAMIDREGNKTPTYNYVKETNKDLSVLSKIYTHFNWQGIMVNNINGGEGNFMYVEDEALKSNDILKSFDSDDDLLIGVFKDEQQRQGFMVTNFTDPLKDITNNVTLDFGDKNYVMVVLNGEVKHMTLAEGKLNLKLNSGEGAFVIPY